MKYSIKHFRSEFPNDEACLDYVFRAKYPELAESFYRVKGRKCYENKLGQQIHPLKGTIFEKSSTPLTLWFHAIYLFSASKNGVAAKELERQLGVTYKTAWRIASQIRKLMTDDGQLLSGEVEVDEAYIGGKGYWRAKERRDIEDRKQVVMGMVQRNGRAKIVHVKSSGARALLPEIQKTIVADTQIYSDEYGAYKSLPKLGYKHGYVKHRDRQFRKGNAHTQNVEGFWSQMKRSINGTYHSVSPKYLQSYADEFAFRYSNRANPNPLFHHLLGRV